MFSGVQSLPKSSGTARVSETRLTSVNVSIRSMREMITRLSQLVSYAISSGVSLAANSSETVPDAASVHVQICLIMAWLCSKKVKNVQDAAARKSNIRLQ